MLRVVRGSEPDGEVVEPADRAVGDRLQLACLRTWQYAGTDGYDCNFTSVTRRAS